MNNPQNGKPALENPLDIFSYAPVATKNNSAIAYVETSKADHFSSVFIQVGIFQDFVAGRAFLGFAVRSELVGANSAIKPLTTIGIAIKATYIQNAFMAAAWRLMPHIIAIITTRIIKSSIFILFVLMVT